MFKLVLTLALSIVLFTTGTSGQADHSHPDISGQDLHEQYDEFVRSLSKEEVEEIDTISEQVGPERAKFIIESPVFEQMMTVMEQDCERGTPECNSRLLQVLEDTHPELFATDASDNLTDESDAVDPELGWLVTLIADCEIEKPGCHRAFKQYLTDFQPDLLTDDAPDDIIPVSDIAQIVLFLDTYSEQTPVSASAAQMSDSPHDEL